MSSTCRSGQAESFGIKPLGGLLKGPTLRVTSSIVHCVSHIPFLVIRHVSYPILIYSSLFGAYVEARRRLDRSPSNAVSSILSCNK